MEKNIDSNSRNNGAWPSDRRPLCRGVVSNHATSKRETEPLRAVSMIFQQAALVCALTDGMFQAEGRVWRGGVFCSGLSMTSVLIPR